MSDERVRERERRWRRTGSVEDEVEYRRERYRAVFAGLQPMAGLEYADALARAAQDNSEVIEAVQGSSRLVASLAELCARDEVRAGQLSKLLDGGIETIPDEHAFAAYVLRRSVPDLKGCECRRREELSILGEVAVPNIGLVGRAQCGGDCAVINARTMRTFESVVDSVAPLRGAVSGIGAYDVGFNEDLMHMHVVTVRMGNTLVRVQQVSSPVGSVALASPEDENEVIGRLGRAGIGERASLEDIERGIGMLDRLQREAMRNGSSSLPFGHDPVPNTMAHNAIGCVYPSLNAEQRESALRSILRNFDGIRYDYVSGLHTPCIREPLLLADIWAVRPVYGPGLKDEEQLWADADFKEFAARTGINGGLFSTERVRSDFLVAYAALRPDIGDFGDVYPHIAQGEFLRRVVRGIVVLRFAGVDDAAKIAAGHARLREILPASLHAMVQEEYDRGGFIDRKQF